MDVFTLLVFFLLVNSSSDAVIEEPREFTLPASVSNINPDNTVEIIMGNNEILVQGEYVMSVEELRRSEYENEIVPAIRDELLRRYNLGKELVIGEVDEETEEKLHSLTVVASREVQYSEMRKIMSSASSAGYTRFSMAVNQKSADQY